jgi:SAM-dependent methyltransferase
MIAARLKICADRINKKYSNYTLLDVGCRTKDLHPLLLGCKKYYGADIIPGDDVFECNLEKKLPFDSNSFDIIAALDVLEHLENPHGAIKELIRISRKAVIISLPNMYYIEFRLRFLRGKGISGKYNFPEIPLLDRHKWILSYSEALSFVKANTVGHSVSHQMILPIRSRTKLISEPLERYLADKWPNLFAYGTLFEITLNK